MILARLLWRAADHLTRAGNHIAQRYAAHHYPGWTSP